MGMSRSFLREVIDSIFSLRTIATVLMIMAFQQFFVSKAKKQDGPVVLKREVHFAAHKQNTEIEHVFVETRRAEYEFSPEGAVLVGAAFKGIPGKDGNLLKTIHERGLFERDQSAFLLALDEQTPLNYTLDAERETPTGVQVEFSAHTINKDWKIVKTFTLFHETYRVDLDLEFIPLKPSVTELLPRLLVPAPFVSEVEKEKVEGGVMLGGSTTIERSSAGDEEYWTAPGLVFLEDKYFLNALVAYEPGFLKQAFFKKTLSSGAQRNEGVKSPGSVEGLTAICECSPVVDHVKTTMSWYCGPKKLNELDVVDVRLSSLMSFGWFSVIGRALLQSLEWLFVYLGNYGWAIVCLTALLRLLFMPFALFGKRKAAQSEQFARKYSSEIAAINARYRDDAATRQNELVKFYDSHGVSFFGVFYAALSGLVSFPAFIALYGLLNNSLSLYNAPFIGWITNLSAPDSYYILPVALAVIGFLYQHAKSKASGKGFQLVGLLVPVFLFAIAVISPAGIVIYLGANLLMIALEDVLLAKFFGV